MFRNLSYVLRGFFENRHLVDGLRFACQGQEYKLRSTTVVPNGTKLRVFSMKQSMQLGFLLDTNDLQVGRLS